MMKRTISLALLFSILLFTLVPLATAEEEPLIITPYYGGPDFSAVPGQEIIIRAGWGACTRGLVQAFTQNSIIVLEVEKDGAPYLMLEPPNRQFWSNPTPLSFSYPNCVMATNNSWMAEWLYSLGSLPAGVYDVHFLWYLDHPLPDGNDHDSDGHLDLLDYYRENEITITIE